MLDFSRVQNYYIACGYTDMRKQIDGLAALVQTQFGQEMDETSLYLFCGKRADRGVSQKLCKRTSQRKKRVKRGGEQRI